MAYKSVVIQNGVESLDPLGIDVTVTDYPGMNRGVLDDLPGRHGQHTVGPLSRIHIHVSQYLNIHFPFLITVLPCFLG